MKNDYYYINDAKELIVPAKLNWNINEDSNGLPFLSCNKDYVNSSTKFLKFEEILYNEDFDKVLEEEFKKVHINGAPINLQRVECPSIITVTSNKGCNQLNSCKVHLLDVDEWKTFDDSTDRLNLIKLGTQFEEFFIDNICYGIWEHKFAIGEHPCNGLLMNTKAINRIKNHIKFLDAFINKDNDLLQSMNKIINKDGNFTPAETLKMCYAADSHMKLCDNINEIKHMNQDELASFGSKYKKNLENSISKLELHNKCLDDFFKTSQIVLLVCKPYQATAKSGVRFRATNIYMTGYKYNSSQNQVYSNTLFEDVQFD
jgi:hypothetical protein